MKVEGTSADQALNQSIEAALLDQRADWERRLQAIQADRRRESAPLDRDFADQAIQRENDATLDALDVQGRRELQAIEAALERLAAGTYGACLRCDAEIPPARLQAQPSAETCIACASEQQTTAR